MIILLNSQGFIRHKDEIEEFIIGKKPTIICLTETHVTDEIGDTELKIDNYKLVRCNSSNSRTGGLLTYIREQIQYNIIKIKEIEKNIWISIVKLIGIHQGIVVCNVYHSPNESDGRFIDIVRNECENIIDMGHIVVVGDFNIDLTKNNHYSKRLVKEFRGIGCKQYITEPTRVTETSQTIIDLAFSNFHIETNVLKTPRITDHNIIEINVYSEESEITTKIEIETRDLSKFNEQIFCNRIKEKIIDKYDMNSDTNNLANFIISRIAETINEMTPKTIKKVPVLWKSKPWITTEVRTASKKRDEAYKIAKNSETMEDWNQYKNKRNAVVKIIRENKKKYYENNIDNRKSNPTKMWKTLKELIGNKKKTENKKGITFNGVQYKTELEISDRFNTFFIQSIDDVLNEIDTQNDDEADIEQVQIEALKKFTEISHDEMDVIIRNMENKKGTEEGISTEILKMAWKSVGREILMVINRSMQEGIFPERWKNSIVVPIPKVVGTCKAEEHRPINILPTYEKLLELAIKKQLLKYMEENNILVDQQSGFREKFSCETALQNTMIGWRNELDNSKVIGVVFLDFKRAFETINRTVLAKKLKRYGISGTAIKWFESYLSNRTQQVKFRNTISTEQITSNGVPQGSVLGPLLFILYINDIVKKLKYCECKIFADDTVIYVSDTDRSEVERKLNCDMINIVKWLNKNSLKLNTAKTKFMLIHDPRRLNMAKCDIRINNEKIQEVTEIKYLGVVIDKHLMFDSFAEYVTKKVAKKVNFLYRINKHVSNYTLVTIYKTIIAPHFEYCSTIFINCSQYSIEMLQKAQNRAMRAILRCNRYTPVQDMLSTLNFMSIEKRINYNICIFVHKIVKGIMPKYLTNEVKLIANLHSYNTRQRENIAINRCKTSAGQKSITYKGFNMYNELPKNVKAARNVKEFKRLLMIHMRT